MSTASNGFSNYGNPGVIQLVASCESALMSRVIVHRSIAVSSYDRHCHLLFHKVWVLRSFLHRQNFLDADLVGLIRAGTVNIDMRPSIQDLLVGS